jgi:hypothetical protein
MLRLGGDVGQGDFLMGCVLKLFCSLSACIFQIYFEQSKTPYIPTMKTFNSETDLLDAAWESLNDYRVSPDPFHAFLANTKVAGDRCNATHKVKRASDSPYPIHQEDMEASGDGTTWCKDGCGNGVHTQCMDMWKAHCVASGNAFTCAIYRKVWSDYCNC